MNVEIEVKQKSLNHALLFATPWTSPGNLPYPEIKPRPPALQVDSLPDEPQRESKNTGVDSLSIPPANLPDPGVKPGSPALQADSLPTEL